MSAKYIDLTRPILGDWIEILIEWITLENSLGYAQNESRH